MAMDLAEKELTGLNATLGEKINAGAPREELSSTQKALGEARERYGKAQRDVRALNTRLDDLQTAFSEARGQEVLLLQAKAETERKASAAERKRILYEVGDWLLSHVPRIVLVLIGMWVANRLVRTLSGRLVKLISRASLRGAQDERENRAHTLIGVFQSTATVLIIGGGIVAILQEIGAPVGPILGGAAIAGLAVAFGAQRLVQDFFHGFVRGE
jgi:small conductance mechanosensitive channel